MLYPLVLVLSISFIVLFDMSISVSMHFDLNRYYDGGRLSDQQMALLQYQRENLHYLNEEVSIKLGNEL